jgi:hypothetical protein
LVGFELGSDQSAPALFFVLLSLSLNKECFQLFVKPRHGQSWAVIKAAGHQHITSTTNHSKTASKV